jgi:multidrug efflux pump subunit AcrB
MPKGAIALSFQAPSPQGIEDMYRTASNAEGPSDLLSNFVRVFLDSNLSIILILLSLLLGAAALFVTPREEDPQIVVPLADVYIQFPGHTAAEVEQLVATPLERVLYQIDGVEYVYSMSRDNAAIVTVRFLVGQDRERSLVKLFKKLNENANAITPGISGWVMKPVEIDDVPIVTFALTGSTDDSYSLRRVSEEVVERLSAVPDVSRSYVVGGQSRTISIKVDPEQLKSHQMTLMEVTRAVQAANASTTAGAFTRNDLTVQIESSALLSRVSQLQDIVIGVFGNSPVFLKDVATIQDGPDETTNYVRHGWGQGRKFVHHIDEPGIIIGKPMGHTPDGRPEDAQIEDSHSAVTIAISKKKGSNAVHVAAAILAEANRLQKDVIPENFDLVLTRNNGLTADHKVNELIEALGVAIVIVILLLTIGLGWREAVIVAVAVPVVFGLTLAVNLIFGYTINRVTLFALILALGLLVDDPIVDVENIARHFHDRKRATRGIVLEAVAEIRPPLISATLAVIVSFLPMFFITGMMGPYMSPMALNVPVAMLMSMVVAFTITPWLTFHMLKGHFAHDRESDENGSEPESKPAGQHAAYDPEAVKRTLLYKFFRPLMIPLLKTRFRAVGFLGLMALLTAAAAGLGALRMVPLKMLPFDNKNEFLLVLDMPEGTTLERTDRVMRQLEDIVAKTSEVTDFTSYVGLPSPIDFNGLVRHYYLREGSHYGEMRVNFVGKKNRKLQSHGLGLRMRDELTAVAQAAGGLIRIVELPPGPPVLASLVAEITGQPDQTYDQLLNAASILRERMRQEPSVVEVDDISEQSVPKWTFVPDQEKAAIAGVQVDQIAETIRIALAGDQSQVLRVEHERQPLRMTFRLPRELRSSQAELLHLPMKGRNGQLVTLAELGHWQQARVGQTIYHKNLNRIVYVFAECVGRPPAECIIDLMADKRNAADLPPENIHQAKTTRPVESRTYLTNGSGLAWSVPEGIQVGWMFFAISVWPSVQR